MKVRTIATLLAIAGIAGAGVAAHAAGKPTPTIYPVTSTLYDTYGAADTPTTLQGDDGANSLATYQDGTSGVFSQITNGYKSDWELDLSSSGRNVSLNLVDANGNPLAGFPTGPALYAGTVISRCFTPTGGTANYSWFSIPTGGDDNNCAMRVNFTYNSKAYSLVMSPAYPGTGLASVHCATGNTGSGCTEWYVAPNENVYDASGKSVSELATLYTTAKNGSQIFVATCRLTYRMHITYP